MTIDTKAMKEIHDIRLKIHEDTERLQVRGRVFRFEQWDVLSKGTLLQTNDWPLPYRRSERDF